jgi:HCOMODA/2-hydroxy-3-carboxy-muconic semialdehyde decarboxylase
MFNRRDFLGRSAEIAALASLMMGVPRLTRAQPSGASEDTQKIESVKLMLAQANRILTHEDVLNAVGHVSARHPIRKDRYLLSRSLSPGLVTRADLIEFDLENRPVSPTNESLYYERAIHGQFYEARPDVNAVVHSHAPAILPFSISDRPMRTVLNSAALMGETIVNWDIHDKFGDTDLLVSSVERGRDLAKTTGAANIVILRGHGCVIVAESIMEVVFSAINAILNAEVQREAMAMGGVRVLTPGEIAKSAQNQHGKGTIRMWEYWLARADVQGI